MGSRYQGNTLHSNQKPLMFVSTGGRLLSLCHNYGDFWYTANEDVATARAARWTGRAWSIHTTSATFHSVVTEKLKHLRIDYEDAHPLFLSLKTPSLETLVLHKYQFYRFERSFFEPSLNQLNVYSFPSLHSFILQECDISVHGAVYPTQLTSKVKDALRRPSQRTRCIPLIFP